MSVHAAKVLSHYQKASMAIVCAHRWEALPFVESLKLKPLDDAFPYPVYAGDTSSVILLTTGMGPLRAAAATGALLARLDREVTVANFGVAAALPDTWDVGSWCLVNKVADPTHGRSYYPDRLLASPVPETTCLSVPSPATLPLRTDEERPVVEMEAAGILTAVESFLSSSRVVVGKFVSDILAQDLPSWSQIAPILEERYRIACQEFLPFVTRHDELVRTSERSHTARSARAWVVEAELLFASLFTVSQKRKLRAALESFALAVPREMDRAAKLSELGQLSTSMKGETKSEQSQLFNQVLRGLSASPLFAPLRRE